MLLVAAVAAVRHRIDVLFLAKGDTALSISMTAI